MGSRLGRRVVNFANLPIKLLVPSSLSNISEIAIKTIPSASKIEIKRVLESLYGFEVEKVRTLNMEGKMKKRGDLCDPQKPIVPGKRSLNKQSKSSIVEDPEAIKKSHWLDEKKDGRRFNRPEGRTFGCRGGSDGDGAVATSSGAKFPWSSMRSFGR
ncbi:mitochondrial ribosomal L23 [Olea europaea subsp. europaea]|uniref:Large ribosomal subunit protein uL23m n=1 Tax=Olea europaea subsp. europaea TaxID=158383 RepID=A0A8S0T0Z0_OLEEU|nr:mitochondrial ribosomal L23 [Olea europaea subsp. europaea]